MNVVLFLSVEVNIFRKTSLIVHKESINERQKPLISKSNDYNNFTVINCDEKMCSEIVATLLNF